MGIIIAGGSGLIGSELTKYLRAQGHQVHILTRGATNESKSLYNWDIAKDYIDPKAFDGITTVINLAGSLIIGGRWTTKRKKDLTSSRVDSSQLLTHYLNSHSTKVTQYIQGSAMGYYGDCKDTVITEATPAGDDFMAHLCVAWEKPSLELNPSIERSVIRIGLYLSRNGGVYKSLGLLAKFYAASAFGDGKMWANYTHRDELNEFILALIKKEIPADVYNVVGENAFMMDDFISGIAKNENRSVILPHIPAFLLKWILCEASATLLNSYRITSPKMAQLKLHKYHNLNDALNAL
ncbi:MAG: TIGR01777 family oxidoreductase [Bacteroidia bacterium]